MNIAQVAEAIGAAESDLEIEVRLDEALDNATTVKEVDELLPLLGQHAPSLLAKAEEHRALALEAEFGNGPEDLAAAAKAPAPARRAPAAMAPTKRIYDMREDAPMYEFPHVKVDRKGNVTGLLSTIENLRRLFELYAIKCNYNSMTKRVDLHVPGLDYQGDDADNSAIAEVTSLCRRIGLPITEVKDYVGAIAGKAAYHPVRAWLDGVVWDGVSRLPDLFSTLTVAPEHEHYKNAMVRRWLISAIAALYSESMKDKFELVLVFTGTQGVGKTSWVKSLCPVDYAVKDGLALNPDEKDSVLQLIKHWLVELGELDGIFRKADIAKLKAFTSRTDDEVRLPYKPLDSRFKRRTVMFGSVNENNFLTDNTGNRRWLTVALKAVDYQHAIDVQQLWAEVRTLYEAGEQWHLTKEETDMLNAMNQQHEAIQPLEELLLEAFVKPEMAPNLTLVGVEPVPARKPGNTVKLNATMVVRGLLLPVDKKNTNEMASLLRKHFGTEKKNGKLGNYWELTPARPAQWSAAA